MTLAQNSSTPNHESITWLAAQVGVPPCTSPIWLLISGVPGLMFNLSRMTIGENDCSLRTGTNPKWLLDMHVTSLVLGSKALRSDMRYWIIHSSSRNPLQHVSFLQKTFEVTRVWRSMTLVTQGVPKMLLSDLGQLLQDGRRISGIAPDLTMALGKLWKTALQWLICLVQRACIVQSCPYQTFHSSWDLPASLESWYWVRNNRASCASCAQNQWSEITWPQCPMIPSSPGGLLTSLGTLPQILQLLSLRDRDTPWKGHPERGGLRRFLPSAAFRHFSQA